MVEISRDAAKLPDPAFPSAEMLVAAALLVASVGSILLTRAPGGISLLWPGSAIAAALLIRLPRVQWTFVTGLMIAAVAAANILIAHRPVSVAVLFTLVNGAEIALMVLAFRVVWKFPYPKITVEQAAIMTALFGIAIPGTCAIAAGAVQSAFYGIAFHDAWTLWWASHTLGACLFGPPLILFSWDRWKRLGRRDFVVALLVSVGVTWVAFRYVRFPYVSIAFPLLVAAFRFGGFGTSVLAVTSALTIATLWTLGVRPSGLETAGSVGSLEGMPVIALLATIMPPIAVGLGADARREAARALRASELRFRKALDHSPIGILVSDLQGVWQYTNLALQKMLGYTAEEFRALPPGGPSAEGEWEASKTRWARLVAGEIDFYDTERRFLCKDGRWIWTHVAVSLMRDEQGQPSRLIAHIESLDARLRAEERLAEERERLQITLHCIRDAVVTTDPAGAVTYANPAAESLFGLPLGTLTNWPLTEFLHLRDPYSSRTAVNLIAKAIMQGESLRREGICELHRADGTVAYVSDSVSPVVDQRGQQTGLVVVFRDAGDELLREKELRRSAVQDSLTELYTRAEFLRRLHAIHARSRQLSHPVALLAIDLDRFKAVNDGAGHAGGDAMLRKVADQLRGAVRAKDTVARLGGDEFAILLEDCSAEHAVAIGQEICTGLQALELEWEGSRYGIGASIGIAVNPERFATAQDWLVNADKACYSAKTAGRGTVVLARDPRNT